MPDGLEHHESSDDRSPLRALLDDPIRRAEANLLPHEYAHSWNGKYRRPAGAILARASRSLARRRAARGSTGKTLELTYSGGERYPNLSRRPGTEDLLAKIAHPRAAP